MHTAHWSREKNKYLKQSPSRIETMQWDCSVCNLAHLRENSSELGLRAVITKHNIKVNRKYSGYTNFASLFYSYILLLLYPYNGPPVIKINSPGPWKKPSNIIQDTGGNRVKKKRKPLNLTAAMHSFPLRKRTETSYENISFPLLFFRILLFENRFIITIVRRRKKRFFFNKSSRMIRKFGSIGGESIF